MIYSLLAFLYVLLNISRYHGYCITSKRPFKLFDTIHSREGYTIGKHRSLRLLDINQYYKQPVPLSNNSHDGTTDNTASNELITVRFINTLSGKDVIAADIEIGENLLAVGDKIGVKLPRACRTGLCGSCTCEVQVPGAVATNPSQKDGYVTIRACSSTCFVPEGMTEMVIDVQRMRNMSERKKSSTAKPGAETSTDFIDPMARFSGDWEREFKPTWEMNKELDLKSKAIVSALASGKVSCQKCKGVGRVVCYACNGSGKLDMGTAGGKPMQCSTCVGMHTVGCGYCRASGLIAKRK